MECMGSKCKHYGFEQYKTMQGGVMFYHECGLHKERNNFVEVMNDLSKCEYGGFEPKEGE